MCAYEDNLRVQLLQHNAIHHKGNDLDDDQNCKHSNGKIAELSDGTLGSWCVQQLVQLSELLGSSKLLMVSVIHLQEQHNNNTAYTVKRQMHSLALHASCAQTYFADMTATLPRSD